MFEGIYFVFIRSLCIFVDILTVCYTSFIFFNIKYEYNITLTKETLSINRYLYIMRMQCF